MHFYLCNVLFRVRTFDSERSIVTVVYTSSTDDLGRSAAVSASVKILYLDNSQSSRGRHKYKSSALWKYNISNSMCMCTIYH